MTTDVRARLEQARADDHARLREPWHVQRTLHPEHTGEQTLEVRCCPVCGAAILAPATIHDVIIATGPDARWLHTRHHLDQYDHLLAILDTTED